MSVHFYKCRSVLLIFVYKPIIYPLEIHIIPRDERALIHVDLSNVTAVTEVL